MRPVTASRSLVLLLLLASACTRREETPSKGPAAPPAVVFVSFQPLADFARRIGGEVIQVRLVCSPDEDPAQCMPSAETIAAMQEAALVFVNGASFERWTQAVSLGASRLVDTSAGFTDELLRYEDAVEHRHGVDGALHKHEGIDGHTWLDPKLAAQQADAITQRLRATWPEHGAAFEARVTKLKEELEALHRRHEKLVAERGAPVLLASHPAYNYVARRYGWKLSSLDLDPEASLDAEARASIEAEKKSARAALILFESPPVPALAEALAKEFGLAPVLYSPAETENPEGDYLAVMNRNLDRLEAALPKGAAQE